MEPIFRKVITKKRSPNENGVYLTDIGILEFSYSEWCDGIPKWWMEKIFLLSDKEIDSLIPLQNGEETILFNKDMRKGAKWMRDYILDK